ncbi:hypothetical protein F5144DRAFT_60421 [Chaetomium tenue]|uniref:Uncharacterized protein n=1 Tax=Chaetomium tenue TaxID=1854479 RepID=A0ACB7PPS6_9PEZI|nr:hypothetical protein F5144DRAFT_60421 [Chaetomium globosum]
MRGDHSYSSYPYLVEQEFVEVCHHFDRKYRQADLGETRRRWRVDVISAVEPAIVFSFGPERYTWLQITRPLENPDDGDLSSYLDGFSFNEQRTNREMDLEMNVEGDSEMLSTEEADQAVIVKQPPPKGFEVGQHGHVRYEVHIHPTYRTPCLWFSLYGLPADEDPLSIDTVFRRLVPDHFKAGMRASTGTLDGISLSHHPVTGAPTFFIHPCRHGEAMYDFDCPKEVYISVWLGLVGQCVGLWVPPEMAIR